MIERSIALLREAGDTVTLEESRALRAELSLEEGDPASAVEPVAREAIADPQKEKDPDDEANAWALLAHALQLCQQHAQGAGRAVLRIFQDAGQRCFDMLAALPERDPALHSSARIWLITDILRPTQRSRTRCSDCISS
jgi:hypothetical protein